MSFTSLVCGLCLILCDDLLDLNHWPVVRIRHVESMELNEMLLGQRELVSKDSQSPFV